jgi:hypothetical protein
MKGVALPIEVLVIVVVAVIVLLGIIAVFFTGWSPFASTAGVESIKNNACRQLVLGKNCGVNPDQISVSDLTNINNLQELCDTYYGSGGSPEACKNVCGCVGITIVGGGGPGPVACTACLWTLDGCADCDDECSTPATTHNTARCVCDPPGCSGGATCVGNFQNGEFRCPDCSARTYPGC